MFTFFSKKGFLVDHLAGFVDIHNHILPGIDDGAKTLDDSIQLIDGLSGFGVKKIICTPHIMHDYYPNTLRSIKESFQLLQEELIIRNKNKIPLDFSAEHMIDENFENLLENNAVVPLKNQYLLIEMSYLQPSLGFENAVQKIASARLFPILAHPERYTYLHQNKDNYKYYKKQGILLQLNLLSLSGHYGNEIRRISIWLLDNGLVDFVATDIHNLAQLNELKETRVSKKIINSIFPIIERNLEYFY